MIARVDWGALDARARGLAAHLLSRAALEELAGLASLPALGLALVARGVIGPLERAPRPAEIETAVRRNVGARLMIMERWSAQGREILEVFFADRDRRSIRGLLRGALQGAPAEARLRASLPTPRLPERALEILAALPTPRAVAAELVLLAHPDGGSILPIASRARPDLLELELALNRSAIARARAAARPDRGLRRFVAARIDLINAAAAVLLTGAPDLDPILCFIEGGAALDLETFSKATRQPDRASAARTIARLLPPFSDEVIADPARFELAALAEAIRTEQLRARLDPLGSAPLLSFLLRLEAEAVDLGLLAWGSAMSAPAAMLREQLVTPWS